MLDQSQSNKWIYMVSFYISLGSLTYAFQMNSLNIAIIALLNYFEITQNKSFVFGILTSSVYIGAFIGSIIAYKIALNSIRNIIIAIDILLISGSILQGYNNIYLFLIGRLIAGIGAGLHSVFVPIYIKQLCPIDIYGTIGGAMQTMLSLGQLLTIGFGILLYQGTEEQFTFIFYFGFPATFSFIRLLILQTFITYDPPIFYVRNNLNDEARKICSTIYNNDNIEDQLHLINSCEGKKNNDLLGSRYALRLKVAIFLSVLFQFCGINAIIQYSQLILSDITSEKNALTLSFLIAFIKLLSYSFNTMIATKAGIIVFINQLGRRMPYLIGNFTMLMCLSLIAILTYHLQYNEQLLREEIEQMEYFIIMLIFIYLIGINTSLIIANFSSVSFLCSIYIPEILPEIGVAVSFQVFWFTSILVLLLFPIVKDNMGITYCFMFFAFCTFIGQFVIYNFVLETQNKNQNQIDQIFKNKQQRYLFQIEMTLLQEKST